MKIHVSKEDNEIDFGFTFKETPTINDTFSTMTSTYEQLRRGQLFAHCTRTESTIASVSVPTNVPEELIKHSYWNWK